MPTVEWNKRTWGEEHGWEQNGDEWSGMAAHCGQPYPLWKQSIVDEFVATMPDGARALEIAPGYGRWTGYLVDRASSVALVDINQNCLDTCREQFGDDKGVTYHLTDGSTLSMLGDASIDFAWSFDSFVHMEPPVFAGYVAALARVLAPGGTAILHHADMADWSLSLVPVTSRAGTIGRVTQRLASQGRLHDSGRRAAVSAKMVARWADAQGLTVASQIDRWGEGGTFTVTKFHDKITTLRKP